MPTLREVRLGKMLSIRSLAKAAGVSTQTIVSTEMGRKAPQFGTMRKIATALEVEPQDITEFAAALRQAMEGKEAA